MVTTREFLEWVLPNEGMYCAWSIKGKRPFQSFFTDIGELASNLVGIDRLQTSAYFACASYKESGKRTQENAKFLQSFWLDIDVKDKTDAYKTVEEAQQAISSFLKETGLPAPTIVHSGNGYHLYWTLTEPITPEQWHPVARNLKQLCYGRLRADPARTSDMASILRPPGTLNWKDPENPKEVKCGQLQPKLTFDQFTRIVNSFGLSTGSATKSRLSIRGVSRDNPQPDQSRFTNVGSAPSEPSFGALVGDKCRQLKTMRDTRGLVAEPVWYAGLGVLAYCVDGEQLAQEWSSGHPEYSPDETAKKFIQAKDRAGPTTCARFDSLNPEGCIGCPFTVTSPVQLGRQGVVEPPVFEIPPETHPWLPEHFKWGKNMELMAEIKDPETDEYIWITVHDHPIYLSSVHKEELTSTRTYGFKQRLYHSLDWEGFSLPARELSGTNMRAALNGEGANISVNNVKHFQRYVNAAVDGVRKMSPETISYNNFGWKNETTDFLLGSRLFCGDGSIKEVAGSHDVDNRVRFLRPTKKGSLNAWRGHAQRLFAANCEGQSIGVLTSFAAPLFRFAFDETEGGSVLSYVCKEGGSGKSTTLAGVASVWGKLDGLKMSKSDTHNAKVRTLATAGNLPVVYDEFNEQDPKVAAKLIRQHTEGKDKLRANQTGGIIHNIGRWQLPLTVASNVSILDLLTSDDEAPMSDRVFEIFMEKPIQGAWGSDKNLESELWANAGHAGPAWLTYILRPDVRPLVEKKVKEAILAYDQKLNLPTNFRFIIRHLACVHVTGALLNHTKLLEFDLKRIMDWAVDIVKNRKEHGYRGKTSHDAISDIIKEHAQGCLIVDKPQNAHSPCQEQRPFPTRGIVMRYELLGRKLFIRNDLLRRSLVQDYRMNYVHVARDLEKMGILLNRNRQTLLTAGTDRPAMLSPCWELDMGHPAARELPEIITSETEEKPRKLLPRLEDGKPQGSRRGPA